MKKRFLILCVIAVALAGAAFAVFIAVNDEGCGRNFWGNRVYTGEICVNDSCWVERWSRESDFSSFEDFLEASEWLRSGARGIVVGPIENEEMAREKAEEVWIEVFGSRDVSFIERIVEERRYVGAFYDERNDVWFLGALPPRPSGWTGMSPHIFIRGSDGQVLAVWGQ